MPCRLPSFWQIFVLPRSLMNSMMLTATIHSQLWTYLTVQQCLPPWNTYFGFLETTFSCFPAFLAGFSLVFPWHFMLVPVHFPDYFSSLSSSSLSTTSLVASSCLMALNSVYMLTTSKFMNLIQTTTLNFRTIYPTAYLTYPPDCPIVISDLCPKLSSWSSLMPQTSFPHKLPHIVYGCSILAQTPNLGLCFDSSFSVIPHIQIHQKIPLFQSLKHI